MKTLLKDREFVNDPKDADLIMINTCAVRLETEERMKKRISELRKYGKKLVVAGCLSGAEPGTVMSVAPEASLIGPQAIEKVRDIVDGNIKTALNGERASITPHMMEGKIGIIPIADGCAGNCNFCITKLARRKLRSYPLRSIIESAKFALSKGAVELELTGQDTAAYGLDYGASIRLPEVVRQVADLEGDFMIRIGMMTPEQASSIIDELIDVLKLKNVYKFIHLPVQSGDDEVLKLMNRKYTIDQYKGIVGELRAKVPFLNVTTDIIVGHPGETEEAFENTLSLMKDMRFERIHLAIYSMRSNTRSASMPQIPDKVKKQRMNMAYKLYEDISLSIHKEYEGKLTSLLLTENGRQGSVIGRTVNYIPVVVRGDHELGVRVSAKIDEASFFDLKGHLI
ncbi:tRNA-2-methylthio-N(6)-dimethylallyladenosine synthase [Sulfuracidifex tepidarius]|uniref:tRNA-t(6)A37 methylthiotransferase n=2 Tax=Sulfuracidifex tepidarius TaxID=1294262 RepID=A0A510E6Z9_9CREN|nr:tRNA-2-methylthio-N(6)-dimethylallyladenosine synthase [Sulfuracidifex tepidarius]BBG28217.1 tRNA-2-methylthio-N(6)-dimethylallyladenosine synthase [Sulfuracidifex tepidarius]